ncbi:aldehyde dehydrogenase family protein [Agrobacterium sp. rho-8.1]|nr:aldehyde dehydrogenase family protein [Agrobacterium sp. rho-8.1]
MNIAHKLAPSDRNATFEQIIVLDAMADGFVARFQAARLIRDESFGPVVAVGRVRDEDHAVDPANDTARGLRVARRVRSGICEINGPTVRDKAQTRLGGVKSSGYGHFGGKADIEALAALRWITPDTKDRHFPE